MNELCSEHHTTHLFDQSYIVLNSTWFFAKIDQYPKIIYLFVIIIWRDFFFGGGKGGYSGYCFLDLFTTIKHIAMCHDGKFLKLSSDSHVENLTIASIWGMIKINPFALHPNQFTCLLPIKKISQELFTSQLGSSTI